MTGNYSWIICDGNCARVGCNSNGKMKVLLHCPILASIFFSSYLKDKERD